MGDLDVYKPKRNSKEEVVAALRELMHLGPNDPAPQPPPLPAQADKDKKAGADKEKDKERKTSQSSGGGSREMRIPKSMARKIVITAALACFGIAALLVAQTGSGTAGAGSPAEYRHSQRSQPQPRRRPSTVPSWINTAFRVTTNTPPFRRTDR